MTPIEAKRVTDTLDMDAIRSSLQEGEYDVDTDVSRSDFDTWLEDLDDDERGNYVQNLRRDAKVSVLQQWRNKMPSIIETGSDDLELNADALSMRGTHYYDSFFQYTNHTTWVYKIQGVDGVLAEIQSEAQSPSEAQEILQAHCEDLSEPNYGEAVSDVPTALIGDVDGSESPRLFHFEDQSHLYVEYWTEGPNESVFDVETGDYKTAQGLRRTCFRIHLDSSLVEIAGDKRQGPNTNALQAFLERFNGHPILAEVRIGVTGIQNAKENLALLVSLDEFIGNDAKIRFARNEQGNVEADPYHSDTESERERLRMNMQLLYGRTRDGWELIYPPEVENQYPEVDDVEVGQVVSDLEESGPYEEILPLTVGLNRDKNSIRFRTKDLSPPTRRSVFHLVADELGWR